jgi:hypothetical protein
MSRKLPGSAIVPGTITVTQITGGLNDTTNASYAQANTARNTANDAYGQANTARDQANTARTQANTAYGQANNAYSSANLAYDQANASYNVANTKLASAGGTLSGDLIITGNLTVSGNSTTLNTEILTVEDAEVVLLSNVASTPALNAGVIVNRGTSANTFLRWDEALDEWGWSDSGTTTYYFEDLRAGLATTNTTFGTVNTSLGTINTSYQAAYAQANTAGTNALNAYGQANAAYAQANSAYGAANNRVLKAGDTMTGNLTFSGTGLRILGDMSNATHANRFGFQTSTLNSSTTLSVYPNGTGTVSQVNLYANQDTANSSLGQFIVVDTSDVRITSNKLGTGNYLPTTFYTGGSERMRLDANGDFSIGITNPNNARMHVTGVGTGPDLGTTAVANATAVFSNSDRDYGMYFAVSGNGNGAIQQRRGATAVYYNLLLQPHGGNVGIGTTSPQAKQHNYISSRSTAFSAGDGTTWHDLIIQNPNNTQGAAVGIAFELNSSYHSNAGTGIAAVKSTASSDYGADMVFVTRPQSAGAAECMRITSGGNVGIANTAPAVRLQIGNLSSVSTSSPETVSLGATFSSSAGGNPKLRVWTDGTNTIGLGVSSNQFDFIATGAYSHVFYQNGSERMRIDTSGHLVPGANATYNLGSTSLRWSTVYTSDLDLSNGIGDWTIVEGEDDLFIYNNKRGKVYKFKLEEVNPATAVPKKENL